MNIEMELEVRDKLKQIKSRFRLLMNGVASQSMREKGIGYKINWGISLPALKGLAAEYGKDYELAIELWKEDIRECKILATLIMPVEAVRPDLAELWVGQIENQEIAEMAAFNLFQYIDCADGLALKWISSGSAFVQICGYNVLARLFSRNALFSVRDINEFIDQAQTALSCGIVSVKHSVVNALVRFGQMDEEHAGILKSAFKEYDLDVFIT